MPFGLFSVHTTLRFGVPAILIDFVVTGYHSQGGAGCHWWECEGKLPKVAKSGAGGVGSTRALVVYAPGTATRTIFKSSSGSLDTWGPLKVGLNNEGHGGAAKALQLAKNSGRQQLEDSREGGRGSAWCSGGMFQLLCVAQYHTIPN